MMSGMRKAPPISISSPRETIASRPRARVLTASRTAAALLLTTVASSAPVSSTMQVAHDGVALAALAAVEVELERQGVAHGGDGGLDCLLGEQRPAEVGVQHGAGEVEDGADLGSGGGVEAGERVLAYGIRLGRGAGCAQLGESVAHSLDGQGATVPGDSNRRQRGCAAHGRRMAGGPARPRPFQ